MNGVWRSLLWKECREQRLKLLMLTLFAAILGLLPLLFDEQNELASAFVTIGFFCLFAVGLFVGASLAASEQSQRTIGFLQALPASTRRTAIAKLIATALTVAAPGVVIFGVVRTWQSLDYLPGDFVIPVAAFVVIVWVACSFALWVAAIAVNLADEVRAGAVGFLAIALFWGAFGVVVDRWASHWTPRSEQVVQGTAAMAPGGPLMVFIELIDAPLREVAGHPPRPIWHLVLLAGVSSMTAAAVYVWRFGRVAAGRRQQVESTAKSIVPTWLAPPMRKPWAAILWKQCCESLPLSLLGAGSIVCITLILVVATRMQGERLSSNVWLRASIPIWIMVGGLVSIVSGIGLWLDDLRPELHAFWRSRPIALSQWFALKFAASMIITLATLALPSLVMYGLLSLFVENPLWNLYGGDDWRTPVLFALLSQLGFFCVAGAFMAATRRPMVSALLTIFTAAGVALCIVGPFSLEATGSAVVIAAISVLATAAGWLCIRHDWAIGR